MSEDYNLIHQTEAPLDTTGTTELLFAIFDTTGSPVTGKTQADFTILTASPGTGYPSPTVVISEVGDGIYRATLTFSTSSGWSVPKSYFIRLTCAGTTLDYRCNLILSPLLSKLNRTLGLENENQYIDQMTWHTQFNKLTSARIRVYSNSTDVGTDNNVIATYDVNISYDSVTGRMTSYKVTRVS